jgi:peroxiredoxin
VACAAGSAFAAGKFNKVLGVGDAAPDWAEVAGIDGSNHSLKDYKDAKVVVQIFTCNECPVAVAYEDRLVEIARDYKDKGVKLVAINCRDSEKLPKMKERSVAKGFTFDYLSDPSQKAGRAYGAKVTPEVFVLDANRKVVYMGAIDDNWESASDVKKAYLRDAIEAALAGKAPEVTEMKAMGCLITYDK